MRREWIDEEGNVMLVDSGDVWIQVFRLLDEWIDSDTAGRCASIAEIAFRDHGPGYPA